MRRATAPAPPKLSVREAEVLALLADGLGTGEIAGSLYMSESTAKTHITHIYQKLGAANRAQALVTAMRLGLLDHARRTGSEFPARAVTRSRVPSTRSLARVRSAQGHHVPRVADSHKGLPTGRSPDSSGLRILADSSRRVLVGSEHGLITQTPRGNTMLQNSSPSCSPAATRRRAPPPSSTA